MKYETYMTFRQGALFSVTFIIKRYPCGHYALICAYPNHIYKYSRLRRAQVELLSCISVKKAFDLKH